MYDVFDAELVGRFRSAGAAGESMHSIPVFINCFNRVTVLRRLVQWLLEAGQRRIILLDNRSTYAPLLGYYEELVGEPRVMVVRLASNFGNCALWASGVLDRFQWRGPFVYTDPDILPDDACPLDVLNRFAAVLSQRPAIMKVGFGLIIDDLPDWYRFKPEVLAWERQFWDILVNDRDYFAPIDTTFALYRGGDVAWTSQLVEVAKRRAIRTGAPYLARHMDWYIDSDHPTEEQSYYRAHAVPGVTSWSLDALPLNVVRDVELARQGFRMIPLPSQK